MSAVDGDACARIVVIGGSAGIGKTALALHWGHLVHEGFPDGQLYLNLRGFDPAGQPMGIGVALRTLLESFGVLDDRLPTTEDAQAALYRSLTAERRMLVILDNAVSVDQIRELLPGSPTCRTLVTSRNRLDELSIVYGARPIRLTKLTADEADQLFSRHVGAVRMAAEADHAATIVDCCGGLPLALSIAGARAAARPSFSLGMLAEELRNAEQRLSGLAAVDGTALDVRAVFSWSVRRLPPAASRLFGLIGLHPGPDISTPAAAALSDLPSNDTRRILEQLTRAHLIDEATPGRYTMHDLLKTYAAATSGFDDSDGPGNAIRRAHDYYLGMSFRADRVLAPARRSVAPLSEPSPGTWPAVTTEHDAMAWFHAEYANLMAVIMDPTWASDHGRTWRLAWTLVTFMRRRARWQDSVTMLPHALNAATMDGDTVAVGHVHLDLGRALLYLGRHDEALTHYYQALKHYTDSKYYRGKTNAMNHIGQAHERLEDFTSALDWYQQALVLLREQDDAAEQAAVLNNMSWAYSCLEDFGQAVEHAECALAIRWDSTLRETRAHTMDSLGYALAGLRRYDDATRMYEDALVIFRDLRHRHAEAITSFNAANAYAQAGDVANGRRLGEAAVAIYVDLTLPEPAAAVRAWLRELDDAALPPNRC
ncbi:tetratricopeptide repeat protein [Actinocrispum wychmicini]|uniref:Tetratricopeptide repeat protein n=2 Tax=Actinocrispum wychmicini TaxID=1213861 RepID=A0A4R2JV24_9PSEU|nr:tetratricopeptide repeat protein [Actinocrispum wychmicini]